jgi:hypothetical protein
MSNKTLQFVQAHVGEQRVYWECESGPGYCTVEGSYGQGDEYSCSIKGGTLLLSECHRLKKGC